MELLNSAGNMLETLNLTMVYIAMVGIGIVVCLLASFLGGDDGTIGDGGHTPGLIISPMSMATFTTLLGGFGLITYSGFSMSAIASVLTSIACSLVSVSIFNYILFKVFWSSGSTMKAEEIDGKIGEVYTSIPENGVGEIIYRDSLGVRQKRPARSSDGQTIPTGTSVVVKSSVDATLIVDKAPDNSGLKKK
ncbi:MAG: hypothetical protein Q4F00_04715 [bacterium]|nr:hypothetical protein [bacterium]